MVLWEKSSRRRGRNVKNLVIPLALLLISGCTINVQRVVDLGQKEYICPDKPSEAAEKQGRKLESTHDGKRGEYKEFWFWVEAVVQNGKRAECEE
jgi:hypothetical protein